MKNKIVITLLLPVFLLLIFIEGCQVNDPHLPSWDVSLNVPLSTRNYTMMDLLNKSSDLQFYSNSNLLYYSQEAKLDNISFSDKLNVEGATESSSQTIGDIKIASDSVTSNVAYDWAPGLTASQTTPVPPFLNQAVNAFFNPADQFGSIKIKSGSITLTIENYFPSPVSITVSGFKLRDKSTGEIIAQSSQTLTIPSKKSGSFNSVSISPNLVVKNAITFESTLSCSGSNGTTITLPAYSIGLKAKLNNLVATEATAKIPAQDPILISNTITIDSGTSQATKFTSLKIFSGTLKIIVDNSADLDANATITIANLKDAQQKVFSRTYSIKRKQTGYVVINNESLKDYTLTSGTGSPTNTISYTITINPVTTTDFRTIKNTDGITGNISISDLSLSEFVGTLKPTPVSTNRSAVSLDVQDLKNKLQFGQINFKNPLARLVLSTSAKFELQINGHIEATNKLGQKATLELNSNTLNPAIISPTDSIVTINPQSLSDFFKRFSSFPDSLIIFAGGVLNPNYKSISVKSTDVVTGKSRIEFPLELGIKDAVFKDSVNLDLSNDDRDRIKDINSLTAGIDITNGLAAAIDFSGDLYDEKNQWLTEFPPKSTNTNSVIAVDGAEVNSSGEPTAKTQTVAVVVDKTTAEKISRAKYMRVTVKLNTTGAGNSPVKFRTSDVFNFHAFASTNYQVKAKENK